MLDIWPTTLPIIVGYCSDFFPQRGTDNVIAALEHRARVCAIDLWDVPNSLLERFVAMAREPFPTLTSLLLDSDNQWAPAIPDSFLCESAPRLRRLWLRNIPFPQLGKLLMLARNLVHLGLLKIRHSAYISPGTMVTYLSGMPALETFNLGFLSRRSGPDGRRQRPPVVTRTVLPFLTSLDFQGTSKYLEDFVVQIDTPMLTKFSVMFLDIDFHIPQLYQFVSRAEKLKLSNRASVGFWIANVYLSFVPSGGFKLGIKSDSLPAQVSLMAAVCRELSPLLSRVDRLDLLGRFTLQQVRQYFMDPREWKVLFHPFIAVQSLHVAKKLGPFIASALQALTGERDTETLPRLFNIFYQGFRPSGPVHEATEPFVTAREQSGFPVAVLRWERELEMYSELSEWEVD